MRKLRLRAVKKLVRALTAPKRQGWDGHLSLPDFRACVPGSSVLLTRCVGVGSSAWAGQTRKNPGAPTGGPPGAGPTQSQLGDH